MTTQTQTAPARSAPPKPLIEREMFYPHPPERVWRALTHAPELSRWLLPARDFAPVPGHRFTLGPVKGEVLESEPNRRLRYTWHGDGDPDSPPTTVTWTLEPHENGTRVRLTHESAPCGGFGESQTARALVNGLSVRLSRRRGSFARRPTRPSLPTLFGGTR